MMETNLKLRIEEIKMLMSDDETGEMNGAEEAPKKAKKTKVKAAPEKKVKAKKEAKPVKVAKKAKPVEAEDGLVSLATVAEQLGISPATARRKLRLAEVERGEGRWKWKPESRELQRVIKALSAEA
jgi:hypothetical protein